MRLRPLFAVLTGLLVCGCMPTLFLLNLVIPRAGYSIDKDVAYGSEPRQKLDIYVPDKLSGPAPVILFFYGGSWRSGTKDLYRAFGQSFATKGIVTVVADYRLYPKVRYPAFLEDCAQAFVFVHKTIAHYGGDPNRIFVAGHSAGAYNAVMLDSDLSYVRRAGGDPAWIRGVIGIAGPYDFLPLKDPLLVKTFGSAGDVTTQPIYYIDGKRAPMLLAAGTADQTVSPGNTKRMAAKLREYGTDVEVRYYPGVTHIGIIVSLAPFFRGRTTLRQDMLEFVKRH